MIDDSLLDNQVAALVTEHAETSDQPDVFGINVQVYVYIYDQSKVMISSGDEASHQEAVLRAG